MLDLFTIKQAHGKIENLNVVLVRDLRFGRPVHSLCLLSGSGQLSLATKIGPEVISGPIKALLIV